MEIRQRHVEVDEVLVKKINFQNFDIFTKLPNEYKEKSIHGAAVSIITFGLIALLTILEIWNYFHAPIIFTYNIDQDIDSKIRINVDMTVAMPCNLIGADVMDQTGSTVSVESSLMEEDINFELTPLGKKIYSHMSSINKQRHDFSSLKQVIWNTNYQSRIWKSDQNLMSEPLTDSSSIACRIHGSVFVKKMPGNFHVTAGKHVEIGFIGGHAHLSAFMKEKDYNFSHRIHHFSFGDPSINMINPMDAEENVVLTNYHLFQYFVEVVPTKLQTMGSQVDTYQYAVREQHRQVDHSKGSHGQPGIFVRYDVSPLQVSVTESSHYRSLLGFLVHLSAMIGGIFATVGLVHQLVTAGPMDWMCRRYKLGKYGALPLDASAL